MKFATTLIAVQDMDRTLKFYKDIFNQDVVLDLGWNKVLTCGLAVQSNFDRLVGFENSTMKFKSHNMELYFETEDFDMFVELLKKHPEVELVHEAKTFPWQQRGIRIYDPDFHIIEISETMEAVGFRLFSEGKSVEEVMKITDHPAELVNGWYAHYLEEKEKIQGKYGNN